MAAEGWERAFAEAGDEGVEALEDVADPEEGFEAVVTGVVFAEDAGFGDGEAQPGEAGEEAREEGWRGEAGHAGKLEH
ncbi:hypothetical protein, partial [Enterococcus faecium]